MKTSINILFFMFLLVMTSEVFSQDIRLKNGKVYTGKIIKETKEYIKLDTGGEVKTIRRKFIASDEEAQVAEQKKEIFVHVYLTEWCPYCQKLERFLKSNNIRYIRHNIDLDFRKKQEYKALGGKGVPFTRIGDYTISGYAPVKILNVVNSYQRKNRIK